MIDRMIISIVGGITIDGMIKRVYEMMKNILNMIGGNTTDGEMKRDEGIDGEMMIILIMITRIIQLSKRTTMTNKYNDTDRNNG